MIDSRIKLNVFHDDNGSFVNHSDAAADYLRDNFSVELIALEDYLYIGYSKEFNSVYAEIVTANTNAVKFTAEVWDGSNWVSTTLTDESEGFSRSGFLFWDKVSMASTTVNSVAGFYVRLRPDSDTSAVVLRGLNLVFANDARMKQEYFEIDNSNILPPGETSHISVHVAARNQIVQELRNLGYQKKLDGAVVSRMINQWDLIDIFEIREAASFLALSKIFFNLSDNPDDHWWLKYNVYQDKYQEMFKVAALSVDFNDNGKNDNNEVQAPVQVNRWRR